jgi:hypothetical protein
VDFNDRLLSLRLHIWDAFATQIAGGLRIETLGRVQNFTRPMVNIRSINYRAIDHGALSYVHNDQWSISYYGLDEPDVAAFETTFGRSIESNGLRNKLARRIKGYRFNWQYPQPVVTPKTVVGSALPVAQYEVRVSGIDMCDVESAASAPLLVNVVAPDNALRIRLKRQPSIGDLFKAYRVYVNGHLESTITKPLNQLYPTVVIGSLVGTGSAPLAVSENIAIRWRYLRVENYSITTREDEIQDGLFDAFITLETTVYEERERPQDEPMREITAIQQIVPEVVASPVNPYLVTITNPVRISNA